MKVDIFIAYLPILRWTNVLLFSATIEDPNNNYINLLMYHA